MNDFDETVLEYYRQSNKLFNRFLSWEHCYEYFYTNKENIDYDKAALMLFCYLASWGMLRNSFLMNHDYKLQIELIKRLIPKYSDLWDCNENSRDKVHNAAEEINNYYKLYHEDKEISDTLQTKILLGIFGCTPAYDRYFKEGVSLYNKVNNNQTLIKTFGKNSYKYLWEFYNKQKTIELCLHNNSNINYPPMKLVDMFFWQIGYDKK